MNYTISQDGLTAVVSSLGSELQHLQYQGVEYLWQADPAIWKSHAPLLFPIVGRLKDGKYTFQGKEYAMNGHGFARASEFSFVKQSQNEIVLGLESNETTRAIYPFEFALQVSHRIENGMLHVTYQVQNTGANEMLFSIGAHEGYKCPLAEGERFEDYRFVFSEKETISREEILPPLIGTKSFPLLDNEKILPLSYADYAIDAIVLIGQKSNSVRLESTKGTRGVEVNFAGWPMLGIWTDPRGKGPYICIEPWYGMGDRITSTGILEEKEGIQRLAAGKTFECLHTIRCF